jgi:hypothetical protein
LLERLDRAADWGAVQPLLYEIQHRIHEDQPYTFLYETKRIATMGRRLSGMQIDVPSDPLARLEECWLTSRGRGGAIQTSRRHPPGAAIPTTGGD